MTSTDIARALREDVLSGALHPGQPLREVAISQRFSVSRGPVRDALRMLVDSGLANLVPNIGVSVREIGFAEAEALYELRVALEAEAVRLATRRATPEALEMADRQLADHAAAITSHPAGAYLTKGHDADFHVTIVQMAGNPLLERLLSNELYPQLVLLRRQHRHVQGRGRIALVEHRRILDSINDRDEEVAALQMRRHIRNSWLSLKSQITEEGESA